MAFAQSNMLCVSGQEKDEDPFCDDNPHDFATLVGAARLGDKAEIGSGFWTGAHGVAVSTALSFRKSHVLDFM